MQLCMSCKNVIFNRNKNAKYCIRCSNVALEFGKNINLMKKKMNRFYPRFKFKIKWEINKEEEGMW